MDIQIPSAILKISAITLKKTPKEQGISGKRSQIQTTKIVMARRCDIPEITI